MIRHKTIIIIFLLIAAALALMTIPYGEESWDRNQGSSGANTHTPDSSRAAHTPFRINDDGDLAISSAVSSGSGSKADPWVIEDLEIDGTGKGDCIFLGNTTDYVIIENCTLHNASGGTDAIRAQAGVYIYNSGNVTINNVTCKDSNIGIYIAYSSHNNTVTNGSCTNNNHGVRVGHQSPDNTLVNLTVKDNDAGFSVSDSIRNTFRECESTSNNNGVKLEPGAHYTLIEDSYIHHNHPTGHGWEIKIDHATHCTINNSFLNSSDYFWALSIYPLNAHDFTFSNNTIYASFLIEDSNRGVICHNQDLGGTNIQLYDGGNCRIFNNTLIDGPPSMYIFGSNNHEVFDNEFSRKKGGDAIYLLYGSSGNHIHNNTFLNTGRGVYLESASGNTIVNNNFTKTGTGVDIRGNGNKVRYNDFYQNYVGIQYASVSGYSIINNTHNGDHIANNILNSNNIFFINNTYHGDFIANKLVNSNDLAFINNTMVGGGFAISGGSIGNWNTHTIGTTNTVNGLPVLYEVDKTTGTVPDGYGQYILANCANMDLEDKNLTDCYYAIELGFSTNINLDNNTVGGNQTGIFFENSNNNYLHDNHAAIYLYNSDGNIITNNTAIEKPSGIILSGGSSGNFLFHNFAKNCVNGIQISSSDINLVANNTANQSESGIRLDSASSNTIENATYTFNKYGIQLLSGSNSNTVLDINVSDNDVGANVLSSNSNQLTNMTCERNMNGFRFVSSNSNTINRSLISNNQIGSNLTSSNSNIIENNMIKKNNIGISLNLTDQNTLENNELTSNPIGIYLDNSDLNTLNNNSLTKADVGINLSMSDNNLIKRTLLLDEVRIGILLHSISENNTVLTTNGTVLECTIVLDRSHRNLIKYNNASRTITGIRLTNADNNTLFTNELELNTRSGIYLFNCTNNTVEHNNVYECPIGILIENSTLNHITNNPVFKNRIGIFLDNCGPMNHVNNNSVFECDTGIFINSSQPNWLDNNTVFVNQIGIEIRNTSGNLIEDNIPTANNLTGIQLIDSNDNSIVNNDININPIGVHLINCINNSFKQNFMFNDGIFIEGDNLEHWNSHHIHSSNTVNDEEILYWIDETDRNLPQVFGQAILVNCTGIKVLNREISDTTVGLELGFCNDFTIINSTFANSYIGLYLSHSGNITTYHNRFLNNTDHARDLDARSPFNTWDNGYPSGGNYWENAYGDDLLHGIDQDIEGSDGMADLPLSINGSSGSLDNYPLLEPFTVDTKAPNAFAGSDITIGYRSAVLFNGLSSVDNVGIINYTWSLFDGFENITLFGPKPLHTFSFLGDFNVTLTVRDPQGNQGTDTLVVYVRDLVGPLASAGPDVSLDEDTVFLFNGTGSTDDVKVWNWTWTFHDGEPVTLYGPAPEYTFEQPGKYMVLLTVFDQAGNMDTDKVNVTVLDVTAPIAHAGASLRVVQNTLVTFHGTGSSDNVAVTNYTWNFRDGSSNISLYGSMPSYVFQNAGIFKVTLFVTDKASNQDSTSINITVLDVTPPVADAGPSVSVDQGTIVKLNGSGSSDNVGIANYTWVFYDGSKDVILFGQMTEHLFAIAGIFPAALTVKDHAGNQETDTLLVTVVDITPPVADAGKDQTVQQGTKVVFDGSGSSDNLDMINYLWTFHDGKEVVNLQGISVSHIFNAPGSFNVTLTVFDASGRSASDTVLINVKSIDGEGNGTGNITDGKDIEDLYLVDSDSDGMPDSWELLYGFDPEDPTDAALDPDGDGVSNLDEYLNETSPLKDDRVNTQPTDDDNNDDNDDDNDDNGIFSGSNIFLWLIIILLGILVMVLLLRNRKPAGLLDDGTTDIEEEDLDNDLEEDEDVDVDEEEDLDNDLEEDEDVDVDEEAIDLDDEELDDSDEEETDVDVDEK